MNQILFNYDFNEENDKKSKLYFLKNKKRLYFSIFTVSIITMIILSIYKVYNKYIIYKKNSNSNEILNTYNISTLYSSDSNYTAISLSNNISIIGLIEIPKINISYPILSSSTEELLKISVCRFSGPYPNHNGNLCIAGHNYKNNMMFSRIDELNIHDSIFISDLNKNKLEYVVYDKYITKENDLSCITETNNIEITLITCNKNNNSKRVVIKAKVKEH